MFVKLPGLAPFVVERFIKPLRTKEDHLEPVLTDEDTLNSDNLLDASRVFRGYSISFKAVHTPFSSAQEKLHARILHIPPVMELETHVLIGYLNVCMYENSVHVYKRALVMVRVCARSRVDVNDSGREGRREGGREGGGGIPTNLGRLHGFRN